MSKGAKGIDGSKGENFLNHGVDYAKKTSKRDIASDVELDMRVDWSLNEPNVGKTWKPGKLPRK